VSLETLAGEIEELRAAYGTASIAAGAPGQTLIRIAVARLPAGCTPPDTPALLVLQDGQRPQFYVKPGIRLPNGAGPRSTSLVPIAGEGWMQFSYSFPWDEGTHSLVQFVEASLRRFALAE